MNGPMAAALVAALGDLTTVQTGRTVNTGTYSYDYADLGDLVRLTRPVLAAHGLAALTPVHAHDGALACTVILVHESGEQIELGPFPFPHGRDAQATGSMVTYHRRYALVAALGMATGDDDDGASAKAREPRQVERPTTHTPRVVAKARLLELATDADQAREAWRALALDQHQWSGDPVGEVETLFLDWRRNANPTHTTEEP